VKAPKSGGRPQPAHAKRDGRSDSFRKSRVQFISEMPEANGKRDLVLAIRRRPGDDSSSTENVCAILFHNPLQRDESLAKKALNMTGFDCCSHSGSAGASVALRGLGRNYGR